MRRAVAILKYLPAVLCGLLVVAWVVSWCYFFGYSTSGLSIGVCDGSFHCNRGNFVSQGAYAERQIEQNFQTYLGEWHNKPHPLTGEPQARFPIPLILGAMLPISIAPFIRFRFPLWSYFAWTALVAVELAYYLG
jgi:hypothetical protein